MPTWNNINKTIEDRAASSDDSLEKVCDQVRAEQLRLLSEYRRRPAICYYSGFLQKRDPDGLSHPECAITDFDMNGFMAVSHNLDRQNGLDIILHTPGGGTEATRAIVEYLYKMFGKDIVVIVPQLAMSAGTMIACASRQIIMGKHSCLGPTDPQINGLPAIGVLHEIEEAIKQVKCDPARQVLWQEVFRKYPPGFIENCKRSVSGSEAMIKDWLKNNMLKSATDPQKSAISVVSYLTNFKETTEHGHHFLIDNCREMGLLVEELEKDQKLQDLVLSVHHAYVASFARVRSIKFIENSIGYSWNISS